MLFTLQEATYFPDRRYFVTLGIFKELWNI